jgi:hypothetical protein
MRRLGAVPWRSTCRSCHTRTDRGTHVCHGCVDRLPVDRRWQFLEAYFDRRRNRGAYRFAVARAVAWLNIHHQHPARQEAAIQPICKEA